MVISDIANKCPVYLLSEALILPVQVYLTWTLVVAQVYREVLGKNPAWSHFISYPESTLNLRFRIHVIAMFLRLKSKPIFFHSLFCLFIYIFYTCIRIRDNHIFCALHTKNSHDDTSALKYK